MKIAYGNRIWNSHMSAEISQTSSRRILRKSYMDIAYGNRMQHRSFSTSIENANPRAFVASSAPLAGYVVTLERQSEAGERTTTWDAIPFSLHLRLQLMTLKVSNSAIALYPQ